MSMGDDDGWDTGDEGMASKGRLKRGCAKFAQKQAEANNQQTTSCVARESNKL